MCLLLCMLITSAECAILDGQTYPAFDGVESEASNVAPAQAVGCGEANGLSPELLPGLRGLRRAVRSCTPPPKC